MSAPPREPRQRAASAPPPAIEIGRARSMLTRLLFGLAFLVVALRLVEVSLLTPSRSPHQSTNVERPAVSHRADIVDRNGIILATGLPTHLLFADPAIVLDADAAALRLAAVLPGLDAARTAARLRRPTRFVRLRRHLTPRQYYEVNRLGLPGLHFRPQRRRVFPNGALAAHVVGFTDVDNRGLSGIERFFNARLGAGGAALALSIDVRVQHAVREELSAALARFGGTGAAGLVLDVASGEVLALVSLPDFDPHHPAAAPRSARFNRATLGVYEMGSTVKVLTAAMALDSGAVKPGDRFDVETPIRTGGYVIGDLTPRKGRLSVWEIFAYSSNLGMVRMARAAGTSRQRDFLARIGMFRPARIELPEIGTPLVPTPWRESNSVTAAYGHGIAVSPLQLASAVAAIVNGGVKVPTTLLRRPAGGRVAGRRIIGARTSARMQRLMRLAVTRGTGKRAAAPGYLVGGKTGTADQSTGTGGLIASFVAAFPMDAPRYVVLVMLETPKRVGKNGAKITGGKAAAPVVGRIIPRVAPLLGVEPVLDAPGSHRDGGILKVKAERRNGEAN